MPIHNPYAKKRTLTTTAKKAANANSGTKTTSKTRPLSSSSSQQRSAASVASSTKNSVGAGAAAARSREQRPPPTTKRGTAAAQQQQHKQTGRAAVAPRNGSSDNGVGISRSGSSSSRDKTRSTPPQPRPPKSSSSPTSIPATATATSTPAAAKRPSPATATPTSTTTGSKQDTAAQPKPNRVRAKRGTATLKSSLKQQIADLKRAKLLQQQMKVAEQRRKQKHEEKVRMEQEKLRLQAARAAERERLRKQREEEKEHLRLAKERERIRKAEERRALEEAKERERKEKVRQLLADLEERKVQTEIQSVLNGLVYEVERRLMPKPTAPVPTTSRDMAMLGAPMPTPATVGASAAVPAAMTTADGRSFPTAATPSIAGTNASATAASVVGAPAFIPSTTTTTASRSSSTEAAATPVASAVTAVTKKGDGAPEEPEAPRFPSTPSSFSTIKAGEGAATKKSPDGTVRLLCPAVTPSPDSSVAAAAAAFSSPSSSSLLVAREAAATPIVARAADATSLKHENGIGIANDGSAGGNDRGTAAAASTPTLFFASPLASQQACSAQAPHSDATASDPAPYAAATTASPLATTDTKSLVPTHHQMGGTVAVEAAPTPFSPPSSSSMAVVPKSNYHHQQQHYQLYHPPSDTMHPPSSSSSWRNPLQYPAPPHPPSAYHSYPYSASYYNCAGGAGGVVPSHNAAGPTSSLLHSAPPMLPSSHQPFPPLAASMSMPMSSSAVTRRRAPPAPKPLILHPNPLVPPSPYADTHDSSTIVTLTIYKTIDPGSTFGVNMKYEAKTALVAPPPLPEEEVKEEAKEQKEGTTTAMTTMKHKEGSEDGKPSEQQAMSSSTIVDPLAPRIPKEAGDAASKEDERGGGGGGGVAPPSDKRINKDVGPSSSPTTTNATVAATNESSPTPAAVATLTAATAVEPVPQPKRKRRRRRRRVAFGVMAVTDATKQNTMREKEAAIAKNKGGIELLRPGDIILSIDGVTLGLLTFQQACSLFASAGSGVGGGSGGGKGGNPTATSGNDDGIIKCVLTVARLRIDNKEEEEPANKKKDERASTTVPSNELQKPGEGAMQGGSNHPAETQASSLPPVPAAQPLIPFVVRKSMQKVSSGDFSNEELTSLVQAVLEAQTATSRFPSSLGDILRHVSTNPIHRAALSRRSMNCLENKFLHEGTSIDREMKVREERHWKEEWQKESRLYNEKIQTSYDYLSLADRTDMRYGPKPPRGCKCGNLDHEYVHDARCVLYRDLRLIGSDDKMLFGKHIDVMREAKLSGKRYPHAVESAYIERAKVVQAEKEASREETKFVRLMEQKQAAGGVAVFAPGLLSVMILSAVVNVNERLGLLVGVEDEGKEIAEVGEVESKDAELSESDSSSSFSSDDEDSSEDEGDDNVPLTALAPKPGSKRQSSARAPAAKKHKQNGEYRQKEAVSVYQPSLYYLAEVMLFISRRYGHVYKEPSHCDNAWRRKLRLDGLNETRHHSKEKIFQDNPRQPGSLSFESLRFILDKKILSRLKESWIEQIKTGRSSDLKANNQGSNLGATKPPVNEVPEPKSDADPVVSSSLSDTRQTDESLKPTQQSMDEFLVAYLLSEVRTGVLNEVTALVRSGVLGVTSNGALVLRNKWATRVEHSLLFDMQEKWGKDTDPENIFCIPDTIKESLSQSWRRLGNGWASRDGSKSTMFNDDRYVLRRQVFEEKYEAYVNDADGVGKFGI